MVYFYVAAFYQGAGRLRGMCLRIRKSPSDREADNLSLRASTVKGLFLIMLFIFIPSVLLGFLFFFLNIFVSDMLPTG